MSLLGEAFVRSISTLLREFGNTLMLVHASSASYDNDTGVVTKVNVSIPIIAVVVNYNASDIDGTSVLRDDRKVYIRPDAGVTPKVGDTIEGLDDDMKIVAVHTIVNTASSVIAYVCQVRG